MDRLPEMVDVHSLISWKCCGGLATTIPEAEPTGTLQGMSVTQLFEGGLIQNDPIVFEALLGSSRVSNQIECDSIQIRHEHPLYDRSSS
jgi:hypothetical protein